MNETANNGNALNDNGIVVDELDLQETDLGEAPTSDDEASDVRNGVYMFVVRADGDDVNATPVMYSLGETGAEPVVDAPADADEFYRLVAEDMWGMVHQLALRTEESGATRSDAMIQLLTEMQNQPQELIHNMLAAMIVEAANAKP